MEYTSVASGTKEYNVYLNLEKPRKSTCNCPLANGKRIICKHIVATYFSVVPGSAQGFEKEQNRLQEEFEKYQENEYKNAIKFINKMSKKELNINEITRLNIDNNIKYISIVSNNEIEMIKKNGSDK